MDKYSEIRRIPFDALARSLGIDMQRFKRRKDEYQGYCPIHQSKKNDNCFSYNTNTGAYHCFSCGAKGKGVIDLTLAIRGGGFKDAVDFLTVVQPLPTKDSQPAPTPSPEPDSDVLRPLEKDTWRNYQVPCEWLTNRIPEAHIRERYGVFSYSNPARKSAYSGRVMIPVRDTDGNLYGYLGRAVETKDTLPTHQQDIPKYLFPPRLPKSKFAFGAAEVKAGGLPLPLKLLYVAESPWTVMRFAMMGLPCISLYGWSASAEQVEIMVSLTRAVCYLPDRNKSQESAGVVQAIARRLYVHSPLLPDGLDDPEELTKLQVLAL